jgi:hypothetical protein
LVWSDAIVDAPSPRAAVARVSVFDLNHRYSNQSRRLYRLADEGLAAAMGCNIAEHTGARDQHGVVDIACLGDLPLAAHVHQVDGTNVIKGKNVLCLCQQEAAPSPRAERGGGQCGEH